MEQIKRRNAQTNSNLSQKIDKIEKKIAIQQEEFLNLMHKKKRKHHRAARRNRVSENVDRIRRSTDEDDGNVVPMFDNDIEIISKKLQFMENENANLKAENRNLGEKMEKMEKDSEKETFSIQFLMIIKTRRQNHKNH